MVILVFLREEVTIELTTSFADLVILSMVKDNWILISIYQQIK